MTTRLRTRTGPIRSADRLDSTLPPVIACAGASMAAARGRDGRQGVIGMAAGGTVTADEARRAHNGGEFCAYFQPIVSLTAGAVVGYEALARWHHPDHGLVHPAA